MRGGEPPLSVRWPVMRLQARPAEREVGRLGAGEQGRADDQREEREQLQEDAVDHAPAPLAAGRGAKCSKPRATVTSRPRDRQRTPVAARRDLADRGQLRSGTPPPGRAAAGRAPRARRPAAARSPRRRRWPTPADRRRAPRPPPAWRRRAAGARRRSARRRGSPRPGAADRCRHRRRDPSSRSRRPPAASHMPSRTRGCGRRCAAVTAARAAGSTPLGAVSRSSTASPAADRPRAPVTASVSPGRAVERSSGAVASPSSVTLIIQPDGEDEVSPPTITVSWAEASASAPA